jgi:methyl coenzyme M reductase beta subunit
MSTPTAKELILAHLVNRGLDRAFAAAQSAQNCYDNITIEVGLSSLDFCSAEGEIRLPKLCFVVEKDGEPGVSATFEIEATHTAATMSKRLKTAIVNVKGEPNSLGRRLVND